MATKKKDVQYYEAVGRRKESVARVRLHIVSTKEKVVTLKDKKMNKGDIVVNEKSFDAYFPLLADRNRILQPLELATSLDRFVITIKVNGGGPQGQVDAVVLGIARALCKTDETYREVLKPAGLLTRDPRIRERRKVGTGGKARRQKQSPKR